MSGVPLPTRRAPILLLLIAIAGCDGDQQEIARLARQQLEQQAAQNDAVLRQSQQLTQAAQDLVEADAQARREVIHLQEQLQSDSARERQSLDRQRDELEAERRQLARDRHREPILAAAILHAGLQGLQRGFLSPVSETVHRLPGAVLQKLSCRRPLRRLPGRSR